MFACSDANMRRRFFWRKEFFRLPQRYALIATVIHTKVYCTYTKSEINVVCCVGRCTADMDSLLLSTVSSVGPSSERRASLVFSLTTGQPSKR